MMPGNFAIPAPNAYRPRFAGVGWREELDDASGKGLLKGRWAGVVDTVGGNYLATALKSTRYGGAVAAIGNAASAELKLAVGTL